MHFNDLHIFNTTFLYIFLTALHLKNATLVDVKIKKRH